MNLVLATTHVSISELSSLITEDYVEETVEIFLDALIHDFGIVKPELAILAFNPHAGGAGFDGNGEDDRIRNVIDQMKKRYVDIEGPFPSDSFFGMHAYKNYDGVIAMYHDQGLIPMKLLSFFESTNVTIGLPIIRTSVSHGTGYDIVGKNIANPVSLKLAIETAYKIWQNRNLDLTNSIL